MLRIPHVILSFAVGLVLPSTLALALGFQLGESKQQLELKYDVSVYDHDSGRVTIEFTLEDEGRLKPINSIDFHIPSAEKHDGGGFKSDLTVSMATSKEGEKRVARIHIRKDWASRAEIHLKTNYLDGKQEPLTWYYHAIPLKSLVARAKPHETVTSIPSSLDGRCEQTAYIPSERSPPMGSTFTVSNARKSTIDARHVVSDLRSRTPLRQCNWCGCRWSYWCVDTDSPVRVGASFILFRTVTRESL